MLRTDTLDFNLPQERIARHPAEPRDAARLMVVHRDAPDVAEHRIVRDLPEILRPGDLMVFNTTRVLPARFVGVREDTGGGVGGIYLEDAPGSPSDAAAPEWVCLVKARRTRPGAVIRLYDHHGRPSAHTLTLVRRAEDESGGWVVRPDPPGRAPEILARIGRVPLPPYILAARRAAGESEEDASDAEDYQTVYAAEAPEDAASVAAPTAGLHFTPELLARLDARGVERAEVTLHVGAGTFKPVESAFVEEHPMHAEWCSMSPEAVRAVRAARADPDRRVIAVGTTSARTLEAYAEAMTLDDGDASVPPPSHLETALLVTPGWRWRWVEGMLTNFHLPRSTLLAMVGALLGDDAEGVERLKALYAGAIERDYRFFSFGDAMLLLP